MNRVLIVALLATFLFTGCIDIVEELFLNADGSGTYTITTDMSAFMSQDMKDLLSEGEEEGNDREEEEPPIEVDTVIMLKDLNPEAFAALEKPEIFKAASLHLEMSDSQEKMILTYSLPFKHVDDINYFRENLSQFTDEGDMGMATGGAGMLPSVTSKLFGMKGKKTLIRYAQSNEEQEALSEEDISMMEMMFADGTYKTVYHFPGKVKKTTIPNAQINGNVLTVEAPLLDVMKGEAKLDGEIKFKRH